MPNLIELPAELIAPLLSHAGDDDYAMLILPLVCRVFRHACLCPSVAAYRLASRVRQVVDALPPSPGGEPSPWLIGHAWGAVLAVQRFFQDDQAERRAAAFLITPGGVPSLQALIRWSASLEPPLPPPASAEEMFISTEAKRLESHQTHSLTLIRHQCSGDRRTLRKEAEAQSKRQLNAACRRTWLQMRPTQRNAWVQSVAHASTQWKRQCQAAASTADVAAALTDQLAMLCLLSEDQEQSQSSSS